jgi:L-asparaginase
MCNMTKNQHSQQNLSIPTLMPKSILLIGTGGTIAGLGGDAYRAAQLPIDGLVASLSVAHTPHIITEQLAQIDSKDISFAVWERLYTRLGEAMSDDAITAIVITHGTDTMEETAYFLHRTLSCTKPVILTGAMRPADSTDSDGARNLGDALAQTSRLTAGVWVAFAGRVFSGGNVIKLHPSRLDAFDVLNTIDQAPSVPLQLPIQHWPRVEIVMNYAGATGAVVDALILQSVDGIVVAGTGNGTVSEALEGALHKACSAGIAVRLATRCLQGGVIKNPNHFFSVSTLPPVQARLALILDLMDTAQ